MTQGEKSQDQGAASGALRTTSPTSLSGALRLVLQPIFAVALGLALGLCVTWIAGEKPWHVFQILVKGAFGSSENIGWTLFHTTPLVFTGLSVAVAFHAGLFNIGAEGQLTIGALAAAALGALWP